MRYLSVLVLVAAFHLCHRTVVATDRQDEPKAIAKIELLGGKVTRDDKLPGCPVIGIDFQESKRLSDKYLHLLRQFPNLTSLSLRNTKITDAGMKEIGKLHTLKSLNLWNTPITDAGLREIRELNGLTELILVSTKITDVGFAKISNFKNLKTLDIAGIQLNDANVTRLMKTLPNIDIIRQ